MSILTNVADLVNPDTGKTYRQENKEKKHQFPIDSLVEDVETGVRLFVVEHTRDCDGSPLYSLSFKMSGDLPEKKEYEKDAEDMFEAFWRGHRAGWCSGMLYSGIPEECLKLIKAIATEHIEGECYMFGDSFDVEVAGDYGTITTTIIEHESKPMKAVLLHDYNNDARYGAFITEHGEYLRILIFTADCHVIGFYEKDGETKEIDVGYFSMNSTSQEWVFYHDDSDTPLFTESFSNKPDYDALSDLEVKVFEWYCKNRLSKKKE